MKMKLTYIFILLLCGFNTLMAQPTLPGQGTDGGNVTDTPINLLIYPFLMLGAYLGFKFFKKS
jgi:hypothetical protein